MILKNTILATFNGVKWYFSAYDMDTTYGLEFDGSKLNRAVTTTHTTFETIANEHKVFELIKRFKTNELKARYKELRANELSESRICNYFENYAWDISSPLLFEDVKKWPSVRGSSVNGIDQICRWIHQRLEVTDQWIDALPERETSVEIKNWVEYAIDTDGSLYNGCGYKDDTRLSSSGSISDTAQTGSVVTGFIPWTMGDVIRMKGAEFVGVSENIGGHYYLMFYDSSKNVMGNEAYVSSASYGNNTAIQNAISIDYDNQTGVTTFAFKNLNAQTGLTQAVKNAQWIRINAYGKGSDLVITINQEIPV